LRAAEERAGHNYETTAGWIRRIGDHDAAARPFGAAAAAVPLLHFEWDGVEFAPYERAPDQVRAALTPDAFMTAWAAGRAMTPEEAVADALAQHDA
jgi:hypothetical protein